MSAIERSNRKDRKTAAKAATEPVVEKTAAEIEEEEYQAQLASDAAEAKAEAEAKAKAEMNGAGAAMKEVEEQKALEEADAAAQALNDAAEALKNAAKQEEPKVELATSHPDMCAPDVFGHFDPSNTYCKSCLTEYTACAEACKALTESKIKTKGKSKSSTPRASGGTREPKVPGVRRVVGTRPVMLMAALKAGVIKDKATFTEYVATTPEFVGYGVSWSGIKRWALDQDATLVLS